MENKTYSVLLPADGLPKVVEFKGKDNLNFFYDELDCEFIDIVNTTMKDVCLVVDDEGLLKEAPKVNVIASLLYGVQQHGQPIVGDAMLCSQYYDPVDMGLATGGFNIETAAKLAAEATEILRLTEK